MTSAADLFCSVFLRVPPWFEPDAANDTQQPSAPEAGKNMVGKNISAVGGLW
jgi:hypothetical protein